MSSTIVRIFLGGYGTRASGTTPYAQSFLGGYGALTRGVYQHLTLNGIKKLKHTTNQMFVTDHRRCRLHYCHDADIVDAVRLSTMLELLESNAG